MFQNLFLPGIVFSILEKPILVLDYCKPRIVKFQPPSSLFQQAKIFFLADGWPQVLDDTNARKDWNWQPEFDLEMMCHDILKRLGPSYGRVIV